MGRLEDSDSVNKTDATPGEEFIRSFTQSQRAGRGCDGGGPSGVRVDLSAGGGDAQGGRGVFIVAMKLGPDGTHHAQYPLSLIFFARKDKVYFSLGDTRRTLALNIVCASEMDSGR